MNVSDFIAGYVGGALAITVVTPIDTVKSWVQHRDLPSLQVIKALLQNEGILGFYRGYTFPVLTIGINNAVVFGVYHSMLDIFKHENFPFKFKEFQQRCAASALGAFGQVLFAAPVECVKIRQQVSRVKTTTFGMLREIVTQEGVLALYRGAKPMFLNDIPGSMIYFLIYESTSDYLRDHYNILLCNEPLYSCLLGGTAGTIAYFPLAPLDHVQTKMMSDKKQKYTGVLQCLRSIIKTNGYLGLYQGAGLYTIRTFPMYGFVFLGYEQAKLFIRTYLPFLDD